MKRISILVAVLTTCLTAGAQNMYDAITFSGNNYYGTARTMALGNAVTAIGGDLGTIGINPAGSAVAGYSQFEFTPGVTISSISSSYSPAGGDAFGNGVMNNKASFGLHNIGLSFCMDTGNDRGLKNFTFAFTSNRTASYNKGFGAWGVNRYTSRFAEMAMEANGYQSSVLGNYDSYYDSDVYWDVLTGYRSNVFSGFGQGNDYAGNTEMVPGGKSYHYVAGDIDQILDVRRTGSKNDIVLNFAANFSDRFYLGFNLGIPSANYRFSELYEERTVNPDMFPITFTDKKGISTTTNFLSGTSDYSYAARITGIYAKVGFIFLPVKGLRIGAAFQTPSAYTVRESWVYSGSSSFSDNSFNTKASSPDGSYTYNLRTPYVVDAGIAYTFGNLGFISADYEMMDYSIMQFRDIRSGTSGTGTFRETNDANRLFCGVSHSLRLGLEIKLTPAFALRAGYSFVTSPEKYAVDGFGNRITCDAYLADYHSLHNKLTGFRYFGDKTRSVSFGAGYSSPGSFYADLAVRMNKYSDSEFCPYYNYQNWNSDGIIANYESPRIHNSIRLWDVALTIGWRF